MGNLFGYRFRPCSIQPAGSLLLFSFTTIFMKAIFTIVLAFAYTLLSHAPVSAQGCVAVRHMSSAVPAGSADYFKQRTGHWQVSAGYRFFRSYKHFVGSDEQKQRVEQGT